MGRGKRKKEAEQIASDDGTSQALVEATGQTPPEKENKVTGPQTGPQPPPGGGSGSGGAEGSGGARGSGPDQGPGDKKVKEPPPNDDKPPLKGRGGGGGKQQKPGWWKDPVEGIKRTIIFD